MDETEGDDLKDFKPLHERQPWMRGVDNAIGLMEVGCLVAFAALFGTAGVVFWFYGGAPP